MIKQRSALLVLIAGALACTALAVLFHASRQRGTSMRERLATLRQTPKAAILAAAAEAPTAATTADSRELAEWAALLEAARRVPAVARREASLRAIKTIQAAHARNPPPPRPVPPPMPKNAMYFAELLDDPEYLQLVAQRWRMAEGMHTEQRLAQLGLSETVRNKVVELEFDSYTASLDMQRYLSGDASARRAAMSANQELRAENDAAIRELLGEEAYDAYRSPPPAAAEHARTSDSLLEPLANRLSYSSAPLDAKTRTQLADLLQAVNPSGRASSTSLFSPEFIDRARHILPPAQIAALEELRAEREALRARSRLPKSSELPRTTRRQRLETSSN